MDLPTATSTADASSYYLLELDDTRPRVLVLASAHRLTQYIAMELRSLLEDRGLCAELGDAARYPPPPADYDAVLIGIPLGWPDRAVESYLAAFHDALRELPAAVFFVGTERQRDRALRSHRLARPCATATFTTPAWPWQPLFIDRALMSRLVDDVVAALSGGT